jgi:hypothetical protein
MTSSDAFAVFVIVVFTAAFAWGILYFLALHTFSRSLQKCAPQLWNSHAPTALMPRSDIQRAFRIYLASEGNDSVIPGECLATRNIVRIRLLVAISLFLATSILVFLL